MENNSKSHLEAETTKSEQRSKNKMHIIGGDCFCTIYLHVCFLYSANYREFIWSSRRLYSTFCCFYQLHYVGSIWLFPRKT